MTKVAAMPIYGKKKTQKKLVFFFGTKRLMTLKLGIGYSITIKFVQKKTLGWPWPILQHGQIWSLLFLYGKMLKL